MAKTKVTTETWTCDQCSNNAEVTARYTKDGTRFEVDLCPTHSKPLIKGARKVALQPTTTKESPTAKIRKWANTPEGKAILEAETIAIPPVEGRGKLSEALKTAYNNANTSVTLPS